MQIREDFYTLLEVVLFAVIVSNESLGRRKRVALLSSPIQLLG